jgi:hypothetical protein
VISSTASFGLARLIAALYGLAGLTRRHGASPCITDFFASGSPVLANQREFSRIERPYSVGTVRCFIDGHGGNGGQPANRGTRSEACTLIME